MVAILLMALFQRFWRWLTVISRTKRLMMDVSSSVGEVVMLGAGSIEHRELVYYTIQKSTTFEPPQSSHSWLVARLARYGFFTSHIR